MRIIEGEVNLAPTDLSNHLNCQHLSAQNLRAQRGEFERPENYSPIVEALKEKGIAHEKAYLAHLQTQYANVVDLGEHASVAATLAAMRGAADVIYQANLSEGRWGGYADFLLKVPTPSQLGDFSYEAQDTKLAQETRAGTILQLGVYSALLQQIQGVLPEFMHVISPRRNWQPHTYRVNDYAAYFRLLHGGLQDFVQMLPETYPEPVSHCDFCNWWQQCEKRRRDDDHLHYVAGISTGQIESLRRAGINRLQDLAECAELPRPDNGSLQVLEKVQHQARVQLQGRETNTDVHELRYPVDEEHGFQRLPEPTPDDMYLDFEGSHFAEQGPQEYLTGWVTANQAGTYAYHALWAETQNEEKYAFETFMDEVMAMRARNPRGHVYHFAPYETAALKRMMGRFGTRARELDVLLSEKVFVDLHAVVKRTLVASVENYSIKNLEDFFGYQRKQALREASQSRRYIEVALEAGPLGAADQAHKQIVTDYNREDCESTHRLQVWLEALRATEEEQSGAIPRTTDEVEPAKEQSELDARLQDVRDRLIGDISAERDERNDEQQARYLLGHMMEFHRREDKASWWEFFRLRELPPEDLRDERKGVVGLTFMEVVEQKTAPVVRYNFPPQDVDARSTDQVYAPDGTNVASGVVAVDHEQQTIDLKHRRDSKDIRPTEIYLHGHVGTDVIRESLMRLGEHVIAHGLAPVAPYGSALKLLTHQAPGAPGEALQHVDEDNVTAACRLAQSLKTDVLAIQGPPGTGKTHTGAELICALVAAGNTVGVVAVGHSVIHNLLEKVTTTAELKQQTVHVAHRSSGNGKYEGNQPIANVSDYKKVLQALSDGTIQVLGGTQWMWSKSDFVAAVDVLVVDEAGQMSLSNVLASAPAAKNLIMLGDPQQLEQPIQSSHPDGSDVAALKHWLDEHDTMPEDRGLFLHETWRLHPDICEFTSAVYYEGKLTSRPGLEKQAVNGANELSGSGLRYVPVAHRGNSARCNEEVVAIEALVNRFMAQGVTWTDKDGVVAPIEAQDVLIVAPYNAQVAALKARLPGLADRIGTVDKFQGQEAAVVIYSMTSSSPDDAPRGMEFLYNPNRFNVATSRARALCVLVGEQSLLAPMCKTVRQMAMANGFCWFGEMAGEIAGEITGEITPVRREPD